MKQVAATVALILAIGACAAPQVEPSPSPSPTLAVSSPTVAASQAPSVEPDPPATPVRPDPSPTPAEPSASPAPSASPSPSPATPAPPPASGVWIGPDQVSVRSYHELDLAVDAHGVAHAAAVVGGGIFYLTNASGSWTRERLTTGSRTRQAIDIDGQPLIALDEDGSVWIAWVHYSGHGQDVWGPYPEAIRYVTNRGGAWSAPTTIAAGGHSPSLQVRDGHVHVAYQVGYPIDVLDSRERYPIRYATDVGGSFSDVLVANHGTAPQLRLARDGTPRVLFGDEYDLLANVTELRYATGDGSSGQFSVERISGSRDEEASYGFALDNADRPRVAWRAGDIEAEGLSVHIQEWDGAWSTPRAILTPNDIAHRAGVVGVAVESQGPVHIVLDTAEWVVVGEDWEYRSNGLLYAVEGAGVEQLLPAESAGFLDSMGIAIDAAGGVHVLFALEETDAAGLWYGVRPNR